MTADDAPPLPTCPVCHHRQDTWRVCPGCIARVDGQLRDLLELHALASLPEYLTPGGGGDGRGTDRPIGVNVAALDLAHGEILLGVLESWERWWRETFHLVPYGVASAAYASRSAHSGPQGHETAKVASTATSRTLTGCVGFLRAWWPRAAEVNEPPPDEFADEVRRLHSSARTALRMHDDRPWSVACPTDGCGYRLHIEHDGRDAVLRCPRCGVSRTLENLLYVARAAGKPCWLDAEAAARALHVDVGHLGPMVRDGRIRARGDRDFRQYDVNSIDRGHYSVPVRRRSGEPTVTRTWTPSYLTADDGLTEEWIINTKTPRRVVYRGENVAAFACARAMSYALHGEVVLADELRHAGPEVVA